MELTIDIEGLPIKAITWGNPEGKPVIALHGWLDNANTFQKIASLLSSEIYLVALDLAGHGLSGHREPNASYYLWDYALDVIKVIDHLGLQKVSIIAHSMGTGVASIIAATMPNRIDKLVFIDGLGAPFVTDEHEIVSNFSKSVRQLNMAKKTKLFGFSSHETIQFDSKDAAIRDRMNNSISLISYEATSCLIERDLIPIDGGYRWRHDPRIVLPECYKMTESQAQSFISAISCETLIILGKQGMFSKGMFNKRLDKFKKAILHWITGGHHLHLENMHPKISSLINEFL